MVAMSSDDPEDVDDVGDEFAEFRDIEENLTALSALTEQQTGLVDGLVAGFDERADAIRWAQRAAIYTLGEFDVEWFGESLYSRADLALLCGPAYAPGSRTVSPAKARASRRSVAAAHLIPACKAAAKRMRYLAVTQTKNPDSPSAAGQKHPGMRPLLSELHARQRWTVNVLLEGFESDTAFLQWCQYAGEASYVEVDGDLAGRVLADEPRAVAYLTGRGDETASRVFRENVAVDELLEAFAAGANEAAGNATEVSEQSERDIELSSIGGY